VVDVTSAIRKHSVFDPWCCLPLFRSPVYLPTTSALAALPVLKESRFIREDVVWFVVLVSLKFMGDAPTSLFGEALNSFGILAAGSQTIVGFDCDTIR
jgi:hypothetical protein